MEPLPISPTVAFSDDAVRSGDPYLFHKTTRRAFYNHWLKKARAQGHWDALFVNEHGHVTEGARSTIFVEIDDRLITPPLDSGVLPGVFRAHLLRESPMPVEVRPLSPAVLQTAKRIFMGNALYGLIEVKITPWEK